MIKFKRIKSKFQINSRHSLDQFRINFERIKIRLHHDQGRANSTVLSKVVSTRQKYFLLYSTRPSPASKGKFRCYRPRYASRPRRSWRSPGTATNPPAPRGDSRTRGYDNTNIIIGWPKEKSRIKLESCSQENELARSHVSSSERKRRKNGHSLNCLIKKTTRIIECASSITMLPRFT